MESVGERLKRIRKENGFTQEELAIKLGLEPAAISKYETNRVPIPQEYIIKICDLFAIPADYLLGRTQKINEPIALAASTKDKIDISGVSDEDRKAIERFIEMAKNKNK